jgi:hypothetical protein
MSLFPSRVCFIVFNTRRALVMMSAVMVARVAIALLRKIYGEEEGGGEGRDKGYVDGMNSGTLSGGVEKMGIRASRILWTKYLHHDMRE